MFCRQSEALLPSVGNLRNLSIAHRISIFSTIVLVFWVAVAILDIDNVIWRLPRYHKGIWQIVGTLVLGLGTIVSIHWLIRACFAPMVELSNLMQRIAQGQYQLRAPDYTEGGIIVSTCAHSLNEMLDVLQMERLRAAGLAEQA